MVKPTVTVKISDSMKVGVSFQEEIGHHAVLRFYDNSAEGSIFENSVDGSLGIRISEDSLIKFAAVIGDMISVIKIRKEQDGDAKQ